MESSRSDGGCHGDGRFCDGRVVCGSFSGKENQNVAAEAVGNVVNRGAIVQVSVVMCAGAQEEPCDVAVHISTDAALSPAFWMIVHRVIEWPGAARVESPCPQWPPDAR